MGPVQAYSPPPPRNNNNNDNNNNTNHKEYFIEHLIGETEVQRGQQLAQGPKALR